MMHATRDHGREGLYDIWEAGVDREFHDSLLIGTSETYANRLDNAKDTC